MDMEALSMLLRLYTSCCQAQLLQFRAKNPRSHRNIQSEILTVRIHQESSMAHHASSILRPSNDISVWHYGSWAINSSGNGVLPVQWKAILLQPMPTCCKIKLLERLFSKILINYNYFHSENCMWKCGVENIHHFTRAPVCPNQSSYSCYDLCLDRGDITDISMNYWTTTQNINSIHQNLSDHEKVNILRCKFNFWPIFWVECSKNTY